MAHETRRRSDDHEEGVETDAASAPGDLSPQRGRRPRTRPPVGSETNPGLSEENGYRSAASRACAEHRGRSTRSDTTASCLPGLRIGSDAVDASMASGAAPGPRTTAPAPSFAPNPQRPSRARRRPRNRLKNQKKTTHFHHSWRRRDSPPRGTEKPFEVHHEHVRRRPQTDRGSSFHGLLAAGAAPGVGLRQRLFARELREAGRQIIMFR